jgi:hypothetical protein
MLESAKLSLDPNKAAWPNRNLSKGAIGFNCFGIPSDSILEARNAVRLEFSICVGYDCFEDRRPRTCVG